jgi:osmotically-inducible protein OsmY
MPLLSTSPLAAPAKMTSGPPPLLYRIDAALRNSPYLNGRHISVECHEGEVTLRGTVPSYYHKQMAQEAVRGVGEVGAIRNWLVVSYNRSLAASSRA